MAFYIDDVEYTEVEYNGLQEIIDTKPVDTFETVYRLNYETKMYEGFDRTEEEKIDWFVEIINIGTITLDEVPEEYKEAVQARLPKPEEPKYTLDEFAEMLVSEVNK